MIGHGWPGWTIALLAALTSAAASLVLTPWVRRVAGRFGRAVRSTEDRWSRRRTARLGGVAIVGGFLLAAGLWVPLTPGVAGMLFGGLLIFGVGLVDDVWSLRPYTKLVAQLFIGCAVVLSGVRFDLPHWPWLAIPLSVFWLVLIINAFNLLDNMDGLAAGIGAIAAGFCAVHAALAGDWAVVWLNMALGGACLGFLRSNFPPARIYMGDSGSHFLGLCLASLALLGTWRHPTQLLSVLTVPALVLAVPIFDTCFVTVQRLLHGRHPFSGGTDHVSHRLAILGLNPRQTVVALYGLSASLGGLSIASAVLPSVVTLVLLGVVVTLLLVVSGYLSRVKVYRLEPYRPAAPGRASQDAETLIETMLLHKRRLMEVVVDFLVIGCAYVGANLLRFEGRLTAPLQSQILQSLPVLLAVKLACFWGAGLYRGLWRYLGFSDVLTVFRATAIGSALSTLLVLYLWRFDGYSRAVFVIDWMLTFLGVGGARIVERLLNEWIGRLAAAPGRPVVIMGAGDAGAGVLRLLKEERALECRVVGFLDDDPKKHGSRIYGVAVLGSRARLPALLRDQGIQEVLVAVGDPPGELLEYVRACCEPHGVPWKLVTAGLRHIA